MMTTNRHYSLTVKRKGYPDTQGHRDAFQIGDRLEKIYKIKISTSSLYRMKKGDKKNFTSGGGGKKITIECDS